MEKSKKRFQGASKVKANSKGITLVALVITIIIIIILATVTINFAFGDSGLIKQAELARDLTANSTEYESQAMSNLVAYMNEVYGELGNSGGGSTTEDGVPIPDGFYYVGGTKEEGVVISDNPADENKGTSHSVAENELVGNQFVWIPVEDDSLFKRYDGYMSGKLQDGYVDMGSEPYAGGYTNEEQEFNEMKASVLANNGFYVGRYEAGTTNPNRNEESGIEDKVLVQQGKNVYNYVGWNNSETDAMNDETGGAVELAKNFDTANGYTSVTSTLIYGVQWDAIMNFIDPKYATENCDASSFVRDSSGKGWYEQSSPTLTGSNGNYAVKNIYDLGGNVFEWTMEAIEEEDYTDRVFRGRLLLRFGLGDSSLYSSRQPPLFQGRLHWLPPSFVFKVGLRPDRKNRVIKHKVNIKKVDVFEHTSSERSTLVVENFRRTGKTK